MAEQMIGTGQISLTKIKKGSMGESAKYVIVNGEQIFRYSDTEMLSIPSPKNIVISASIYNINTTNIKWYYKKPSDTNWTELNPSIQSRGLTGKSQFIVDPNGSYWNGATSLTFACFVDNNFYDELTIVKLAEGNSFSAILSNESQTIATDVNGNFDEEDLNKIKTEIQVFKGTEKLMMATGNVDPQINEYTLKIVNNSNLEGRINSNTGEIEITSFSKSADTGYFDVQATIKTSDASLAGKSILKRFTLTKAKQGEQGTIGEDAKQVTVVGQNLFVIGSDIDKTVTPSYIKITGISKNITDFENRSWQHLVTDEQGNQTWEQIIHKEGVSEISYSATNYSTLILYPNALELQTHNYLTIRYWVDTYYDEMSIAQISESSGYIANLTNESHTVAVTADGRLLDDQLDGAYTLINAYKNTSTLEAVEAKDLLGDGKFYAELETIIPADAENIIAKTAPDKFSLHSISQSTKYISGTIRIYCESEENYIDKTVTFTKSYTGEKGEDGEDAYILSLDKDNSIIKLAFDEGIELSDYEDVNVTASVYQGGEQIGKYTGSEKGVEYSIRPSDEGIQYSSTIRANGELYVDVTGITGSRAYLDIVATIKERKDNVDRVITTITKRYAVVVISEGQSAKYVELSYDEQYFIFDNKVISSDINRNTVSPNFIRIYSNIYNFKPNPETSFWQYLKSKTEDTEVWETISSPSAAEYIKDGNSYQVSLFVDPYEYWGNKKSLTIRYIANSLGEYSDTVTLQRVQDSNTLVASLTNENITLTADSNGNVDDIDRAYTYFNVYYGNNKLKDDQFNVELLSGANSGAVLEKVDNKWMLYLTSLSVNIINHSVKVSISYYDEISETKKYQETILTFTVSKALQGLVGPQGPAGPAGATGEQGYSVHIKYLMSGFTKRFVDIIPIKHLSNTTCSQTNTKTLLFSMNKLNAETPYIEIPIYNGLDITAYRYLVVRYKVKQGNPETFKVAFVGETNSVTKTFGPQEIGTRIDTQDWATCFIDLKVFEDEFFLYPQSNNITYIQFYWTSNTTQDVQVELDWLSVTTSMTNEPGDFIGTLTAKEPSPNVEDYLWSKMSTVADYDWVNEWNSNKTLIGDSYFVSPQAFFGKKNNELKTYSGIALNMKLPEDNIETKGIIGYNNNTRTFTIDQETGVARFGNWNSEEAGSGSGNDSFLEAGLNGLIGTLNGTEVVMKNLNASHITTGTLDANKITVTNLNASNITTGTLDAEIIDVVNLNATNITSGQIDADKINVVNLDASNINTGTLNADRVNVINLNASNITTGTIDASLIRVENIDASNITTGTIDANRINVANINASNINTGILDATLITTGVLDASKINVKNMNADSITSGTIDADLIHVVNLNGENIKANTIEGNAIKAGTIDADRLVANSIGAGQIQAGAITAGSGIIASGAIGDAEISSLSASKITAGVIDTSLITVSSRDSVMEITGNQIMINDTTDVLDIRNRVILGKYNKGNEIKYGLLIRGEDGTTIMFDERGVHNAGITDGAIDNNKVSDNANISGKKLDINSVITTINEDGSINLSGTKVQVGDRTLDVELSTQNQKIEDNSTKIESQKAQISALDDKISLKVDNTIFEQYETTVNGKIEELESGLPYQVNVFSSNGEIFKNGNIETVLTLSVIYKGKEIVDTLNNEQIIWTRVSRDPIGDQEWNRNHKGKGKSITITSDDVYSKAVFEVEIINL